ncbi:hypothetical protein Tco_0770577 [Tanacetum coccineum]|uniref:Uncharacterized protein n=1 Tax=Tanacetum coccineum TaxID=301880 RepID=A0ABQ4ZEJ9_9ASTR
MAMARIRSQNSAMAWLLSGHAQESRISRIRRRGNKELNGLEEEINSQRDGGVYVAGGGGTKEGTRIENKAKTVAGTRYCSSEVAVRGGRECQVAVRGGGGWPIRAYTCPNLIRGCQACVSPRLSCGDPRQ